MTESAAERWLLDVNVLLAIAWPRHMHHGLARNWFLATERRRWASCAVTQLGFIRLSSNAQFTADAVTPPAAAGLLQALVERTEHAPVEDRRPLELPIFRHPALVGHRQVTDAYLLDLARVAGLRLATFDRGLVSLGNACAPGVVDWIGSA